ncbi:ribosomal RNA small subunit methyltransferase A [Candidatus Peregrinibacteria bacterium HGW-Peregrinibacteria-1]|jgi:16S rRNA (adenine1518-N6/adenine1519-N6)-dimethyltransferase|nr:MAG: ribosomal RNA small subunit methyltransferase A [Candidatus Peregrinibacteria bacterium HGW-Peregrinibacteria-1]
MTQPPANQTDLADLTDINQIKALLQKHNLWAKKSLGQNFLTNSSVIDTIIQASQVTSDDIVLEIGPGLGVLTKALAQKAQHVHSIEIDQDMLPILNETLSQSENVTIIPGNSLKIDLTKIISHHPYKVVANIPYYITSPLLNLFLQNEHQPESITFLVQKEVAEKICHKEPDMSVLALQVHLFGTPKLIATVKNSDFHPAPKVDSAILHINLHQPNDPSYLDPETALKILKTAQQAFTSGRKKLSNTLPHLKDQLQQLHLDTQRPQHLSIKNWLDLIKIST